MGHPKSLLSSPIPPEHQKISTQTLFSLSSSLSRTLLSIKNPKTLAPIHSLLLTSGLARSAFFTAKLITKYSELGNSAAFFSVFLSTPTSKHNVFLWNTLIRSCTQNFLFEEALDKYDEMGGMRLAPDAFTFPPVLSACAGLGAIEFGRKVHRDVREMGFGPDLYISNSLINMYTRLGSLIEAREVFDGMPVRDLVSWNSLISGYSANGEWEEALETYRELRVAGDVPDCFTVESVMPAIGGLGDVVEGKIVHGIANKIGIEKDKLVSNGIIAMYCRFGNLDDAYRVFDTKVVRDLVSWNIMIDGYFQVGSVDRALELIRKMAIGSKPDLVLITIVLRVCYEREDLRIGRSIHGFMLRNQYEWDTAAYNMLILMYSKCGKLDMSREVFDRMVVRDSVSWNSLINGYVSRKNFNEGVRLFKSMKESGDQLDSVTVTALISVCSQLLDSSQGQGLHSDAIKRGLKANLFVSNALVGMYSKCDLLEDALKVFDEMEVHDSVSWTSIISGCVQNGNYKQGFKLLTEMKLKGNKMDEATMLSILPACSFLASKRQGREVHGCILKVGLEHDVPIGNALIEMYSKCGILNYAERVFETMDIKDVVTWTALISAYGMYGQGEKALRAFRSMEETGIIPDHIVFVALMYACSHGGLLEEGKLYFKRMEEDYKIVPRIEHYACMVDLLSRHGQLVEAENFILSMPIEADASIWGALLSSCRVSGETQMAERIAEKIMTLNWENPGYYVLVSNVYASMGKWNMVGNVRKVIKDKKLKKDPGYSWIEIRNKVYVFGTGDQLVEQSSEMHQLLEKLDNLMAKEGYILNKKFVLQDVEEDDKRYMLCTHSERLAIAFGLLNTKPGTPLQIMKNLRVCGDCHTATKYISKIVQRELLVRDANRFHLFKDGSCSCGDYW
ncbi:uncharacterized protein A4U43_C07F8460 [Asparagus officinalis]|uniref:DYW domain-containing protein n=1 Tax=Asparagus officinalis TaxID=4686 RepID=A0A5P1EDE7_ASPOF|nr:pentatricopeptide repeat-containing protein At3g03580 [Asparagus officinalis]XP_020274083.1 pentatricopeptide repeat-containing protein At3g03580 [Asparagus officinalis]ONK62819.1 uncharacterized protein A4U43_C07F8460 [Asparagus officinalis]